MLFIVSLSFIFRSYILHMFLTSYRKLISLYFFNNKKCLSVSGSVSSYLIYYFHSTDEETVAPSLRLIELEASTLLPSVSGGTSRHKVSKDIEKFNIITNQQYKKGTDQYLLNMCRHQILTMFVVDTSQ